jgi:hypothetical protein
MDSAIGQRRTIRNSAGGCNSHPIAAAETRRRQTESSDCDT